MCKSSIARRRRVQKSVEPLFYDLASLTKPLVTAPLAFRHLDLDAEMPFRAAYPPVTARRLLSHAAGLPPWLPFTGEPLARQLTRPRPWGAHPLLKEPQAESGVFPACYSDLGFRLLAEAIAAASGRAWRDLGEELSGLEAAPWQRPPLEVPPGPDREAWQLAAPATPFPPPSAVLPHDANARAGMTGHAGFGGAAREVLAWLRIWRREFAPRMVVEHAVASDGTRWGLGLWRVPDGTGQFGALLDRLPPDGRCYVFEDAACDLPPEILPAAGASAVNGSWWMHTGFTGPALFFRPADSACVCLLAHRRGPRGELLDMQTLHRRRMALLAAYAGAV